MKFREATKLRDSSCVYDEYRKAEGICPRCGMLNWVLPIIINEQVMTTAGQIRTKKHSEAAYTCTKCECKWKERWDI